MWFRRVFFVLSIMAIGVIHGCGGNSPNIPRTVSVSGKVTLEGKPLVGAEVHFVGEKFSGIGVTNSDGKYSLAQGAVPGTNKLYITKFEGGKSLDPAIADDPEQLRVAANSITQDPTRAGSGNVQPADIPHEIVPSQYSDPQKSKLSFPVPESGAANADFQL